MKENIFKFLKINYSLFNVNSLTVTSISLFALSHLFRKIVRRLTQTRVCGYHHLREGSQKNVGHNLNRKHCVFLADVNVKELNSPNVDAVTSLLTSY